MQLDQALGDTRASRTGVSAQATVEQTMLWTMTERLGESRAGVLGRPLAWWRKGAVGDRSHERHPLIETWAVPGALQHGAQIVGEWLASEYAVSAEA
jgi:hypothetical protein